MTQQSPYEARIHSNENEPHWTRRCWTSRTWWVIINSELVQWLTLVNFFFGKLIELIKLGSCLMLLGFFLNFGEIFERWDTNKGKNIEMRINRKTKTRKSGEKKRPYSRSLYSPLKARRLRRTPRMSGIPLFSASVGFSSDQWEISLAYSSQALLCKVLVWHNNRRNTLRWVFTPLLKSKIRKFSHLLDGVRTNFSESCRFSLSVCCLSTSKTPCALRFSKQEK